MYIDVLNKIYLCRNYVYFDLNFFKILRIIILLLMFVLNGVYIFYFFLIFDNKSE